MESSHKFSQDTGANTVGTMVVLITLVLWSIFKQPFKMIKYQSWENFTDMTTQMANIEFFINFLFTGLILLVLFSFAYYLMKKEGLGDFIKSFLILYLLSSLVYIISAQKMLKNYFEYAFWALILGLIGNNLLGISKHIKSVLISDFYVKVGLVLMGCEVIFSNIANFGIYGIAISWSVVPIVIIFMWWFGVHFLKMKNQTMVMVIAVATSVCGVSAAVAAAASIKADKKDLTFAVGISIIFTIVMMIFMPMIIDMLGISQLIGGAWIGNTIDSTGAVVLAGESLGQIASQAAAMIKMIQNVLIGFVSFIIAIFFAKKRGEGQRDEHSTMKEIWVGVPKFIFGFFAMSILFSFIIMPGFGEEITNDLIKNIGTFKGWCFCLTFLCIGLETNFAELKNQLEGGKPITLYVVGQLFSLILSLGVCYLVLSGKFIPSPDLKVL